MSLTTQLFNFFSYNLTVGASEKLSARERQKKVFESLISAGKESSFGEEHGFNKISTIKDFQNAVPLRDYDKFESYIDRIRHGEQNVLWNQPVKWFAKSSGTSSSKSKYVPITEDSLYRCHFLGMRKMLSTYLHDNPKSKLFSGNALTLGGSMTLDEYGYGNSFYGDLSAIMVKNSNFLVELRRVPPKEIALIPDFEKKVELIAKSAKNYNVTNFAGVPSWNLIMMNKIIEYNNVQNLLDLWPNLELFMHGGINFNPYREQFKKIIPSENMNYRENYNASEGYFAYQDDPNDRSLLLVLDNGIFYEFIPLDKLNCALAGEYNDFLTIEEVSKDVNYALVISANNGLWRYLIGDTIKFTSLAPYKIIVSGRTQLYINVFGEELMIGNAESALALTCQEFGAEVENFTVAPIFMIKSEKGAHQWFIEFSKYPENLEAFAESLDKNICDINSDYEAKRAKNSTMRRLTLSCAKNGCFYEWLRSKNKLGGQNKVPRLSNKRDLLEELLVINERL